MADTLNARQLLDHIVKSIENSGWQVLILSDRKPFELRVFRENFPAQTLHVYIWNCTHGGGAKRAADEYRIQFTSVVPEISPTGISLLLGWHSDYEVFVGWDLTKHSGQNSSSPSAQVKEKALIDAHKNDFALHLRQNAEIVVAFRPQFLVDYALSIDALHQTLEGSPELSVLDCLPVTEDQQLDEITDLSRREVVRTIVTKYRAYDFSKRVLTGYQKQCAVCGLQLGLIDAAHIVPVADENSTDETCNGIALCKTHHAAYDRNLISFDTDYKIEISEKSVEFLAQSDLLGGLDGFKRGLKDVLTLPADKRDFPKREYIEYSKEVRRWEK